MVVKGAADGEPGVAIDVRGLLERLKMSEIPCVLLYERTPSTLLCPACSVISCSSAPGAYNLVVQAALSECLVRYPGMPGAWYISNEGDLGRLKAQVSVFFPAS